MKPKANQKGVDHGMACRSRMKLFPLDSEEPYPLDTNLMTTNVAGPGTMALFRYQGAILVWAVVLMLLWLGLTLFVSTDLLKLGTRNAESPQLLCAVVAWGHRRQMELVWVKVVWLAFAYAFSFFGAIAYGVVQSKMFAKLNAEEPTMPSFACLLKNVPKFTGREPVEETLKAAVKEATGVEPVGVSMSWDYGSCKGLIDQAIEHELEEAHGDAEQDHYDADQDELTIFGKLEKSITDTVLEAWHVHLGHHAGPSKEKLKNELAAMETAEKAYVVFPTQAARKQAEQLAARSGIKIKGETCQLKSCMYAPEGIFWKNMQVTNSKRAGKLLLSTLILVLCCAIWTFLLYIPYALYMSSFSYANGDEPGEFSEGIFISLVVGSQLGLFVVSSIGAKYAAFHTEDETQQCYMLFYNAALILNLIMDIALQAYLSYLQMVGVGAHVADGRLLSDLTSFQQIFESYPVQKSVGKLLFLYCWPCTFLVPFLAEPIGVQWLPWHLAQKLVGANKKIQGENAVKALELGEMEQGRYADCIFNVILVVCIPFISPAYLAWTFAALIVSHTYIYVYDQVKVLRYVRRFNFSGPEVHWFAMQLWAIPCSILAGGLVVKVNQMSGDIKSLGSGFLEGYQLGFAVLGVMVLHFAVHLLVLEFFVRPFELPTDKDGSHSFSDVASKHPATHFSTNPIHCLRSKYVLNHSPPQIMYEAGKEHLMKANAEIGAYHQGKMKK